MTPGYDASATFNPQLPPRHDQYHPALFAAAWTSSAARFDADPIDASHDTDPESTPTVKPPACDPHLLPTVRPAPMRMPTTWANQQVRAGRLAFSRSRDCHGLVRSFV
jgi:hypothetical protein